MILSAIVNIEATFPDPGLRGKWYCYDKTKRNDRYYYLRMDANGGVYWGSIAYYWDSKAEVEAALHRLQVPLALAKAG